MQAIAKYSMCIFRSKTTLRTFCCLHAFLTASYYDNDLVFHYKIISRNTCTGNWFCTITWALLFRKINEEKWQIITFLASFYF